MKQEAFGNDEEQHGAQALLHAARYARGSDAEQRSGQDRASRRWGGQGEEEEEGEEAQHAGARDMGYREEGEQEEGEGEDGEQAYGGRGARRSVAGVRGGRAARGPAAYGLQKQAKLLAQDSPSKRLDALAACAEEAERELNDLHAAAACSLVAAKRRRAPQGGRAAGRGAGAGEEGGEEEEDESLTGAAGQGMQGAHEHEESCQDNADPDYGRPSPSPRPSSRAGAGGRAASAAAAAAAATAAAPLLGNGFGLLLGGLGAEGDGVGPRTVILDEYDRTDDGYK